MKVLFVFSANKLNGINTIVSEQGQSLIDMGIDLSYFSITEKGLSGYLKAAIKLRSFLKKEKFQIIHAHYSLSAFAASLAGAKPLFVSLMGSDVKAQRWYRYVIKFFNFFFWSACIVKTEDMKSTLKTKNVFVLPNGVNLNTFKPIEKKTAQNEIGWDLNKQHILFASDPERPEKNFELTNMSFNLIKNPNLELHFLKNIDHSKIPLYLIATDVVVLTSFWEGSPNIIKEAMACSRPIVSTKIGDVEWLFNNIEGHYLTEFNADDLSQKMLSAIDFSEKNSKTFGRERISKIMLDKDSVASKLIKLYEPICSK